MQKLIDHYNNFGKAMVGLAFLAYTSILQFAPEVLDSFNLPELAEKIVFHAVTITALFSGIYIGGLRLYKKRLWKYFYPSLNYCGDWEIEITYKALERAAVGKEKSNMPEPSSSVVSIEQTPFHIKLINGVGENDESWKATNVEINEDGNLTFVYEVNRQVKKDSAWPRKTMGYEESFVLERKRKRPYRCKGSFHHIALEGMSLYRGTSTYRRLSKKEAQRRKAEIQKSTQE